MRRILAIAAGLSVVLSGCGGDQSIKDADGSVSAPVVTQTSEPTLTNEDVRRYVEGVSSADDDGFQVALSVSEPGSVAYAFAYHQQQLERAYVDAGQPSEADEVTEDGDGFEACSSDGEDCTTYTDFGSNEGKLATLRVNGKDLSDRVALGDKSVIRAGNLATIRFLSAYKTTATGDVFVIIEVRSKNQQVQTQAYAATYRTPSGRQSKASQGSSDDVLPNSVVNQVMIFPSADLGGTVNLEVVDEDYGHPARITIKTG